MGHGEDDHSHIPEYHRHITVAEIKKMIHNAPDDWTLCNQAMGEKILFVICKSDVQPCACGRWWIKDGQTKSV